jgi:molecular chaperone DnaK
MAEIAIGIDLGTSNSCVAVVRRGAPEVLPNAFGEPTSASVVTFQQDGSALVGNAAKANLIHDPRNTVCSAKRLIGRYFFSEEVRKAQAVSAYQIVETDNHGVRVGVRSESISLPEISAMVLREMKSIAEANLGQEIHQAVITVPAYFNDNQRQATRDAGRIAGLEVLRLLNEPTAAALAYGFGRGLNQKVAVYDLGGGTFDISILEIGEDVYEVLSTYGDTFLGGDDFDDRLIDLLAEEFLAQEGINLRKDPFALEKLKLAAESAKKGLSVEDEVEIRIPDVIAREDGKACSIVRAITTQEYLTLVTDLIKRTFSVCDEALQQAGLTVRDLDGVILVGGPTRLPAIRTAVAEHFQQQPKFDVDPDQVVAMGAAIHAASLVGGDEATEGSMLLDVTPLSLCIGVAGGLAETVIERNTPVPIEQTRTFTTFQDQQESVKIRVCQGESRTAEENELLGQFTFSGFRRAPRGEVRIEVTFEIDTDGLVNVTARDPDTGQQASTQITLTSGLSPEEVDRLVAEGSADRVRTATPAPTAAPAAPQAASATPPSLDPSIGQRPDSADEELEVLDEDFASAIESDEAPAGDDPETDLSSWLEQEPPGGPPADPALDLGPESLVASDEPDVEIDLGTTAVDAMPSAPEAAPEDEATQPRLIELGGELAGEVDPLLEGVEGLEIADHPLDASPGYEQPEPVDEPLLSDRESLFGDLDEDLAGPGEEPEV